MPDQLLLILFVKFWENISFYAHDKGGVRSFFNQRTSQTQRFEMHVTTLNPGLESHDPHTHKAEEIILIVEGNTGMLIGTGQYKAGAGDLYYLGSNVLHGIKNIGTVPTTYFAYQWE